MFTEQISCWSYTEQHPTNNNKDTSGQVQGLDRQIHTYLERSVYIYQFTNLPGIYLGVENLLAQAGVEGGVAAEQGQLVIKVSQKCRLFNNPKKTYRFGNTNFAAPPPWIRMFGTYLKVFSQAATYQGYFLKQPLPKYFQTITSQVFPSRSAGPPILSYPQLTGPSEDVT